MSDETWKLPVAETQLAQLIADIRATGWLANRKAAGEREFAAANARFNSWAMMPFTCWNEAVAKFYSGHKLLEYAKEQMAAAAKPTGGQKRPAEGHTTTTDEGRRKKKPGSARRRHHYPDGVKPAPKANKNQAKGGAKKKGAKASKQK